MTDEADNVLRFPIERRRAEAYDAETYFELQTIEGVSIGAECNGTHVFVNRDVVCQCGQVTAHPDAS